MKKEYYSINNQNSIKDSNYLGLAFVMVSKNEIKHIAGDKSLTRRVEFRDGNLVKKNSKDNYEIISMGEMQFETYKERYLLALKQGGGIKWNL